MEAADRDEPSCSVAEAVTRQEWPINRAVAVAGMTLLWNLFRKSRLTHHGAFIDTDRLSSHEMPIDPDSWAFYGYSEDFVQPKRTSRRNSPATA